MHNSFLEDKARAEVQFWSQNVYPGSRAIEVVIETDEKGRKSIMIGLIRFCPDASKTSSLFYVFQCIRNGRGCNAYILVFKQSPNFAIAVNNHSEHQRVSVFIQAIFYFYFQYDDRDYNSIGQLVFLTRLAKICDQLDKDFLDVESDDVPDVSILMNPTTRLFLFSPLLWTNLIFCSSPNARN
jgi:hypothetical protein